MKKRAGPGMLSWLDRIGDHQARQLALLRATQQRQTLAENETTGLHDTGGIGTPRDLDQGGKRNGSRFYGFDEEGRPILDEKLDSCSATIGQQGCGKGSTCLQPLLGWAGNEYSIVSIGLGAEAYRVSSDYRGRVLGQKVALNNSSLSFGIEGIGLDPLTPIRAEGHKENAAKVIEKTRQVGTDLLRIDQLSQKREQWVEEGALGLFMSATAFLALEENAECTLPGLQELFMLPPDKWIPMIAETSQQPMVKSRMAHFVDDLKVGADKQLHWKIEKIRTALEKYERGTELGNDALKPQFDVTELRRTPSTLYIEIAERSLDAQADHIRLLITSLVEQLTDAPGPQRILFVIDEMSNLPRMNLPVWQRTLRKKRIHFATFWQTFSSIEQIYGKAGAIDILQNCNVVQHLSIDREAAKHLSERAGTSSVFGRSMSFGADGRTASDSVNEIRRPNLAVGDLLSMPSYGQIIEFEGMKLIKGIRFPWWEIDPFAERLTHFSQMKDEWRDDL